jgi:predicted transcriptional regulator
MSANRDRVAIIKDILSTMSGKQGVKPTQIMYKANLSYQMLTDYLADVLSKGLVAEQADKKGKKTYTLLQKGYDFLRDYEVIKKFFDSYALND